MYGRPRKSVKVEPRLFTRGLSRDMSRNARIGENGRHGDYSPMQNRQTVTKIQMRWQRGPLENGDLGTWTFIAIIANPFAILAKIASLQGATFGIQFKSPEAGDFSPFSPLQAFLDISGPFIPCLYSIYVRKFYERKNVKIMRGDSENQPLNFKPF